VEPPSITAELVVAVQAHDLANVVRLLAEGADANVRIEEQDPVCNEVSEPLLMIAAAAGVADIVRALLDAGAHVDAQGLHNEHKCRDGMEFWQRKGDALEVAAVRGHADVVELLLQRGATKGRAYALLDAVRKDHLEMVKLLVESGAHIDHPQPDDDGTPFATALVLGRVELVRYFIERGAKPPTRARFEKIVRYHDREVAEAVLIALGLGVPEYRRRKKNR
jgi:ankyrin repeat protein